MRGVEPQRAFLNSYYGRARYIYDITRKYYLFGRDRALFHLLSEEWSSLVEVGPGTGRNLQLLHNAKPRARLGGVEPCDVMLEHARERCPWASLTQGFGESADFASVHGERPHRVLFSYCLSMALDPHAALARARRGVAPGGSVFVVDFADMGTMPRPMARALRAWLAAYRVTPLPSQLVEAGATSVTYGPMRYYAFARFPELREGA